MALSNALTFTLNLEDSTGATTARRTFTVTDDLATVGEFRSGTLTTTALTAISLPITQPRQILVRNTHASAKITLIWTPYGGASATITTLGPSACVVLWDPTAATATIGVSALSLTSDTANATYELALGG